jgi:GntR family transcriptional regulator/MocR family aminotransferase
MVRATAEPSRPRGASLATPTQTDAKQDRTHFPLAISGISLNMGSPTPIYTQLCTAIRAAIMTGELPAGTLMPTSRELALALGVGRNTVNAAYSRLGAEGYLEAKFRRGTRVAASLSSQNRNHAVVVEALPEAPDTDPRIGIAYSLERTLRELVDCCSDNHPFAPHVTDPTLFPRTQFSRLLSDKCGRAPLDDQGFDVGAELRRFQNAVAVHMRRTNGIVCNPAQILPTVSAESAIDLAARLTIDAGHAVQIEQPSWDVPRAIFGNMGARLYDIPSDGFGANPDLVIAPPARLVYVSPSLSFPFGVEMPETRRLRIIDHARASGAFIFENDSYGELLFGGSRLKTIQSLEPNRVLYFGSFNCSLGPKIRASYLVVPEAILAPAVKLWRILSQGPDQIVLSAIATFIEDGRYAVHAKKIRAVYAERMARLTELCRDRIPEAAIVEPRGGLHLTLKLPCEIPAAYVCGLANMHKIGIVPLEQFFAGGMKENGVVLGIGMCHDRHREQLVAKLAEFIRETARGSASRFAAE